VVNGPNIFSMLLVDIVFLRLRCFVIYTSLAACSQWSSSVFVLSVGPLVTCMYFRRMAEAIEMSIGIVSEETQGIVYEMGVRIGATWQIRLNDCPRRL